MKTFVSEWKKFQLSKGWNRHCSFLSILTLQKQQNIDLCSRDLMSQDFCALIENIWANLHLQFAFVFVARSCELKRKFAYLLQNLLKDNFTCPRILIFFLTELFLLLSSYNKYSNHNTKMVLKV